MSIPLSEQIQREIDKRKQEKLAELAPLTVELLEDLCRQVVPFEYLAARAQFLLKSYREVTRRVNRGA